jgi:hypothetical protein
MELVVADPSSVSEETLKNSFQSLFTKFSSSSNSISYHEMCVRLLKSFDNERRIVKFLLKQFVADGNNVRNRSGNMMRELERLKKENTQLKQGSNSQRIQFDQTTADLQHRVQALNATVQELQKKLAEKDIQISQFRQLCASEGMARLPSSSGSVGSGGRNRNSSMDTNDYFTSRSPRNAISGSSNAPPLPLPPMQGFVLAKQAREQAKAQALGDMSRSRAILPQANNGISASVGQMQQPQQQQQRRRMEDINSVITPIQIPNNSINRMINTNLSPMNIGGGPTVPNTPRIRDLSANSGYAFTTRSNINSNNVGGGGKRDRSHSPSITHHHQQFGFANNGHRGTNHRF